MAPCGRAAAEPPLPPAFMRGDVMRKHDRGECPAVRCGTPSAICSYLANASSPKGGAKAPSGRAGGALPLPYGSGRAAALGPLIEGAGTD